MGTKKLKFTRVRRKGTRRKRISKKLGGMLRASRSDPRPIMPKLDLGGNSKAHINIDAIRKFIHNELQEGPQIVNLPTPPQRHAFLVDINTAEKKVKISDWTHDHRNRHGEDSTRRDKWDTYYEFLLTLEEYYKMKFETEEDPIEYYDIDEDLKTESMRIHGERGGTGGCSDYICKWATHNYPNYQI